MRLVRTYFLMMMAVASFISILTLSRADGASLAIFNFRAAEIEVLIYNSEILYSLISDLERKKGIKLIPRRKMETILAQNNLAQSNHPEIVIKAGQALGADFILFGNVAKQEHILAKLKLMDIANRRVVKTWKLRLTDLKTIPEQTPVIVRQLTAAASVSSPKGQFPSDDSEVNKTNNQRLRAAASGQSKSSSDLKKGQGERLPYPPLILSYAGQAGATEIKFVPALRNMKADIAIVNYKIYRHDPAINEWTLIQTVNARGSSKSVFTIKDTHAMKDDAAYHYALTSIDWQGRESHRSDSITVQTSPSSHDEHLSDNEPLDDAIEQGTSNIEHQTLKDAPALDNTTAKQDLADNASPNDIIVLPGTPVLSVARDNQLRQTDLIWHAQANTEGYHLYRKSQKTDWHKIATITAAEQCQYTDTVDLEDGQTYHYYLTAYNSEEETEPSEQVNAKTKGPPPCPQEISASWRSDMGAKITWKPLNDSDVGGYIIYRRMIANKSRKSVSVKEIAQVKGWRSDTYIDQDILSSLSDTQYYYSIKSFNLFNAAGVLSEAVLLKPEP
ncbi:fibronectin type III domain-containing protein [Desulfococcaceae bacterium HSG9]|nr:fibronectin type III domain-containing protein [Desulfococcaceae bacterium HSG9]